MQGFDMRTNFPDYLVLKLFILLQEFIYFHGVQSQDCSDKYIT